MIEREPHGSEVCERYKLMRDVPPFFKSGRIFEFWPESAIIYADGTYPLRQGLSGYLRLLRTEPGYFRKVK